MCDSPFDLLSVSTFQHIPTLNLDLPRQLSPERLHNRLKIERSPLFMLYFYYFLSALTDYFFKFYINAFIYSEVIFIVIPCSY